VKYPITFVLAAAILVAIPAAAGAGLLGTYYDLSVSDFDQKGKIFGEQLEVIDLLVNPNAADAEFNYLDWLDDNDHSLPDPNSGVQVWSLVETEFPGQQWEYAPKGETGSLGTIAGDWSSGSFYLRDYSAEASSKFTAETDILEATASPIPEPTTLILLGAGILGTGVLRRRTSK
jgi:hypothetical protein